MHFFPSSLPPWKSLHPGSVKTKQKAAGDASLSPLQNSQNGFTELWVVPGSCIVFLRGVFGDLWVRLGPCACLALLEYNLIWAKHQDFCCAHMLSCSNAVPDGHDQYQGMVGDVPGGRLGWTWALRAWVACEGCMGGGKLCVHFKAVSLIFLFLSPSFASPPLLPPPCPRLHLLFNDLFPLTKAFLSSCMQMGEWLRSCLLKARNVALAFPYLPFKAACLVLRQ